MTPPCACSPPPPFPAGTFANLKKSKIKPVIVIFPEGTRQTAKKFKEARAFTVSRNMEPLRHLMHPRPRGFVATVTNMRDSLDSVVDVTIGFPEQGLPSLWQWVRAPISCPCAAQAPLHPSPFARAQFQGIGAKNTCIHCRRFPIADLPLDDEEALKRWLFDRFKEKDELLDRLYRTGSFEEGAGTERVDLETAESGRKGYGGNKVTPVRTTMREAREERDEGAEAEAAGVATDLVVEEVEEIECL